MTGSFFGCFAPTTDGGTIMMTTEEFAERPDENALWDEAKECWVPGAEVKRD